MEQLASPAFNPHIKRVLQSYQSAAVDSLSGPGTLGAVPPEQIEAYRKAMAAAMNMNGWVFNKPATGSLDKTPRELRDPFMSSPPFPVQSMPVFMPMDNTRSEKSSTTLEGEKIACFVVGGEKRLCLPQILNSVLRDFNLSQINNVCDELQIYCSRCNSEQLTILKQDDILPEFAPSCGLITKTDSERLCNALLHSNPEKASDPPGPNSFRIYHECFGKCKGIFSPELYTNEKAKCIECVDCHGMFSTEKFVCHSHKALENRTCHWGFDSANWRSYLLLSKDQEFRERYQDALDHMKSRFDPSARLKRKEGDEDTKDGTKRGRYEEDSVSEGSRESSAFRPWSPGIASEAKDHTKQALLSIQPQFREGVHRVLPPYLHTGPPVLLNPEKIIPHSDSDRYERHFAPNVSLAPATYQKAKEEQEDKEEQEMEQEMEQRSIKEEKGGHRNPLDNSDGKPPPNRSLSPIPKEEEEDTMDIEISSDTDSSLSSDFSSVASMGHEDRLSELVPSEAEQASEREMELDLLQRALDTNPEDGPARERILDECKQQQEHRQLKVDNLISLARQLRKDMEEAQTSRRERLQAARDAKKILKQELDQLRYDQAGRLRQLELEKEGIRSQVEGDKEALKQEKEELKAELDQVKSKYKSQLETLRSQLTEMETGRSQLHAENALLKLEFKKSAIEGAGIRPPMVNGSGDKMPLNMKVGCGGDAPNGPTANGHSTAASIIGVTPKKLSRLRMLDEQKRVIENGQTNGKS